MRQCVIKLRDQRGHGEHPGLLLTRYLAKVVAGEDGDPEEKRALYQDALRASASASLRAVYGLAFARWRAALAGSETAEVGTPPHTRLIVGLGNKGVIEAGLRLHHTYGTPLVPGSALKGVAAHYCHEAWGGIDDRYKRDTGDYHRMLFGTQDEGGCIRFEDAWMVPDGGSLLPDVMTPHHQKWQTDEDVAPTDFDSPVPVPFLSVGGRFLLAVSWHGPPREQAGRWTKRALVLLKLALAEWGVGGKTSSGYGRLVEGGAKTATAAPAAAVGKKRDAGAPAKVTIVAARPKGGFDVQEEGRAKGTLTIGTPPAGAKAEAGAVVDVFVHVDDPRAPQYKWTHTPPAAKPAGKPRR